MSGVTGRDSDHPRVRGEHVPEPAPLPSIVGSSPRSRGALRAHLHRELIRRIIPAFAGSTRSILPGQGSCPDHPRVRGEHPRPTAARCSSAGSSPRSRGAPIAPPKPAAPKGIIPAFAGSTSVPRSDGISCSDHPRAPGEHPRRRDRQVPPSGSSPRSRGARRHHHGRRLRVRIIPAFAGSTSQRGSVCDGHRDHPRVRGEHPGSSAMVVSSGGSSPRSRGALWCRPPLTSWTRIIPAFAGSTSDRAPSLPTARIIPAFAGSTRRCPRSRDRPSDHPRVRGEHGQVRADLHRGPGSSPRSRGAHTSTH